MRATGKRKLTKAEERMETMVHSGTSQPCRRGWSAGGEHKAGGVSTQVTSFEDSTTALRSGSLHSALLQALHEFSMLHVAGARMAAHALSQDVSNEQDFVNRLVKGAIPFLGQIGKP